MLQSLAQFRVALLDLFEQADVLDCNNGLVCEGLEKGNLFFGEGTYLGSANLNRTDSNSLTKQRRDTDRSRAGHLLAGFCLRILSFKQRQDIMDMNRLAFDDRTAGRRTMRDRTSSFRHRHRPKHRYVLKNIAVDTIDQHISRI